MVTLVYLLPVGSMLWLGLKAKVFDLHSHFGDHGLHLDAESLGLCDGISHGLNIGLCQWSSISSMHNTINRFHNVSQAQQ